MKNANWLRFQEILLASSDDWIRALDANDIEVVWDTFITSVKSALNIIAPYVLVSPRVLRHGFVPLVSTLRSLTGYMISFPIEPRK